MPTPIFGEAKFSIWNKEYVFGITNGTESNVHVAHVNDLVIDYVLGTVEIVTAVDNNHIPTLRTYRLASGFDGDILDNHPSVRHLHNRRLVPDFNIWWASTGGVTPKVKMVGQPDTRIVMECREAAKYRVFLGSEYSDTTGNCISGDPSIGDLVDTGTLTLTSGTFKINAGLVNLSMQLTNGEVVTVVFYDNSNNVISIRAMRVVLRGAAINTYSSNVVGYSILSKFNSSTDYNFLDCRFTPIINREDFTVRKHFANGSYNDLLWNNTECSIVGLDAFLSGDSGHKCELILVDKSIGFSMVYHIEKGGSSIVETPTGLTEFDWYINLYDLAKFNTIYNGNERPQAVNRSVVIYPKEGWEVNARPTTLTIEGIYTGSNAGGSLGAVTVFDKAGNKISYNNSRTYEYGDNSTPNRFKSIVSLYYVGDNDIGGAIVVHADTDMSINKVTRSGTFTRNMAQFGIQAVGSLVNYAFDLPNGVTEIPLALAHKRSINNELPIAEGQAFTTQGGYPWLYGYLNKPAVSNIRYGEFLIPTYGDTAITDQGIEFLGRDIDLSDNQYIIEAVFCLRQDFTFDPELARGILEGSSNPQNVVFSDSQVVVPIREYVIPPPVDTGPENPNPQMIPQYTFDPSNNVLYQLPVPQYFFDNDLVEPDYKLYGMEFPSISTPTEPTAMDITMTAGNPPYYGGYIPNMISAIPKIGMVGGTAAHFAYNGNDCLLLDMESVPQGQAYFISFWTNKHAGYLFQTGESYLATNEAPGYVAGKTPKKLCYTNDYIGIHCAIVNWGSGDTLSLGTGAGQGPYYQEYVPVPPNTGMFNHIVIHVNSSGEMRAFANTAGTGFIPIDYGVLAHNLYLFGDDQPGQLSNVVPIYRNILTTGLEVYYGDPDQDFINYLYAKTPYTGFSERMYVDDIFNVINKNASVPYFIKAQGEKLLADPDLIYRSPLLVPDITSQVITFSNNYSSSYIGYSFRNFNGDYIPWILPADHGPGGTRTYSPYFDLTDNLGNDNLICITYSAYVASLDAVGDFFHGGNIPWTGYGNPNSVYVYAHQQSKPVLSIRTNWGFDASEPVAIEIYSVSPNNSDGTDLSESLLGSGSCDANYGGKYNKVAVVIIIDKVAGTLAINVNGSGSPITNNVTFNGALITAPFNGNNYNFFMPGGNERGYGEQDRVSDMTISKRRISVDEYNAWVNYVHNNQDFVFKGGVIAYDTDKRAYLDDIDSMYASLEMGSVGGAALRYRNKDPINNINGVMVTTKTDPASGSGATAMDKLSLLPVNDITEIEWRIKIYSLDALSVAPEAGIYLLEKHTDENYEDGYTLQWGNGFYNLTFNTPVNTTDTGLILTSPTSNVFDIWHTGKYIINGNTISFYLNDTLVSTETFPPENARRIHTDGPLRIGTSVTNSNGAILDVPTGGEGFASTDFDLDYLRIKQNGVTTFNLYFGVQNPNSGGGVQPPAPPLPYFIMKIGDNELKVDTVNKRASWINTVEGLLVEPTTDLLSILNRNSEVLNTITLVRKGARAAMFINGSRVWVNDSMDYDEDVGAQPVVINWGRTTEYGPVPYLQSLMVYTGATWIDDALAANGSVTIPVADVVATSDMVRIDNTLINNVLKSVISNVINFNTTTGYNSLEGDIIEGNYPWV